MGDDCNEKAARANNALGHSQGCTPDPSEYPSHNNGGGCMLLLVPWRRRRRIKEGMTTSAAGGDDTLEH